MRVSALVAAYGAALVQGLTVVSFPASGAELRGTYGLDDAGYGALFLPQMALTIAGSLVGATLARRAGLRALLVASSLLAAAAEVALARVGTVEPSARLPLLLCGTGCMGAGFGLAAAPLNGLPALLFPARKDIALVALHTSMGAGFALGPLAVAALAHGGHWVLFPSGLVLASVVVAAVAPFAPIPSVRSEAPSATAAHTRARSRLVVGLFLAIAVLYAFAEGTFANWGIVFLTEERHVPAESAPVALSAFWGALAIGRLLTSIAVARVAADRIWMGLLGAITIAFLVIPLAAGPTSGVVVFVLAGLACSAFFPLTVGLVSELAAGDPAGSAALSSATIAALMVGVGMASFALGALHEHLSLETLYRLSAGYPIAAAVLGLVALRARAPRNAGAAAT